MVPLRCGAGHRRGERASRWRARVVSFGVVAGQHADAPGGGERRSDEDGPVGGGGRVALPEQGDAEEHGDDRVDDGEARDDHLGRPGRERLLDEPATREDGGDHARDRGEHRGVEDADLPGGDGLRGRPHQRGHQPERGGARHGAHHAAGPAGAGEPDAREHEHDEPHDETREQHRPPGAGVLTAEPAAVPTNVTTAVTHTITPTTMPGVGLPVRARRGEDDGDGHRQHPDGLHHRQRARARARSRAAWTRPRRARARATSRACARPPGARAATACRCRGRGARRPPRGAAARRRPRSRTRRSRRG